MKIAIDARMYGNENSGIGRYIVNLIDELVNLDRENKYYVLLVTKYFKTLSFPSNWEKIEANFRHYSFWEQIKLPKILKNIDPDVVHFPHFNVPLLYKQKYVVTIHDLSMHKRTGMQATTLPPLLYLLKRAGYKTVFKRAVSGSQAIITPTRHVQNELVHNYPQAKGKTHVTYEGVDKKTYQGTTISGDLKNLGIEKPYFLYVGNSYPHKNISRAIDAVLALNSRGRVAMLVVVTPKNIFMDRLNAEALDKKASESVRILGFQSDEMLEYLYKQAAAFVYPSKEEGFGLPGLEAMANKTLVLASDIPVFKEVYKDNALYFNPHDFSSIQNAMSESLSLSRLAKAKITDKAYDFTKTYSWEKTAKETLKVYESCASL